MSLDGFASMNGFASLNGFAGLNGFVGPGGVDAAAQAALCAERAAARDRALVALTRRRRLIAATASELSAALAELRASDDTWRGPAADAFASEIAELRAELTHAIGLLEEAAGAVATASARLAADGGGCECGSGCGGG